MKHHLSGRKQFLAFALAAAFGVVSAFPALALHGGGGATMQGFESQDDVHVDVMASYDSPVYGVAIEWGSMDFHYKYGSGWEYNDPDFNKIKVTNLTVAPVAMELEFEGKAGYQGTFNTDHAGAGDNYEALYFSPQNSSTSPSGDLYLVVNGTLEPTAQNQQIGSITLRLVDVLTEGVDTLTDKYEEDKIGHVTLSEGLVPFDKANLER